MAADGEGWLWGDGSGERVGDAEVVGLVEQCEEAVVLSGLLSVAVFHDGEDLDVLLDDAVVHLWHPCTWWHR